MPPRDEDILSVTDVTEDENSSPEGDAEDTLLGQSADDLIEVAQVPGEPGDPGPAIELDPEILATLLQTLSQGGNIDDAMDEMLTSSLQFAQESGATPQSIVAAVEAFRETLVDIIAQGVPAEQAVVAADLAFTSALQVSQEQQTGEQNSGTANALATGEGIDDDSPAFQQALEEALAEGATIGEALAQAEQAQLAQDQIDTELAAGEPTDELLDALASGENIDGSGAAFEEALAVALEGGADIGEALAQADQAAENEAQVLAEQLTDEANADPLLAALASGNNDNGVLGPDTSGMSPDEAAAANEAFQDALAESLANGQSPEQALANAENAGDSAATATAEANQGEQGSVLAQLASGNGDNLGPNTSGMSPEEAAAANEAFQDALNASLGDGASPEAAAGAAAESGAAAATAANEAAQGEQGSVLAQLASGNTEGLGPDTTGMTPEQAAAANEAFSQQLSNTVEDGGTPEEGVAAGETVSTIAANDATPDAGTSTGSTDEAVNTAASPPPPPPPEAPAPPPPPPEVAAAPPPPPETPAAPPPPAEAPATPPPPPETPVAPPPPPEPAAAPTAPPPPPEATPVAPPPPPPIQFPWSPPPPGSFTPLPPPPPPPPPPPVVSPPPPPSPPPPVASSSPPPPPTPTQPPQPAPQLSAAITGFAQNEGVLLNDVNGAGLSIGNVFSNFTSLAVSGLPSWATYNAALQKIEGQPAAAEINESATVQITATNAGGSSTTSFVLTVNDVPDIGNASAGNATFSAGSAGAFIDDGLTISDTEDNFTGGSLRIEMSAPPAASGIGAGAGGSQGDRLNILGQTVDGLVVSQSGNDILVGGIVIGSIQAANNGQTDITVGTDTTGKVLVIDFNADASSARVQALIKSIQFENTNATVVQQPRSVEITLIDENGGTATYNRTVDAFNNQRPDSSDVALNVAEDTPLVLTSADFAFNDPDNSPVVVDTLQDVQITQLPNSSTGKLQLSGTDIDLNDVISIADITAGNLIFVPALNYNGAADFKFVVGDGDQFTLVSGAETATITIAPINDAPEIDIPGATSVHRPGIGATVIAPNILFNDVDAATVTTSGQMNGGFLQADISAGRTAGDLLSIIDQGTSAGQIGFDGSNVTYEGTTIGTVAGASNGGSGEVFRVTFNADATPEAIEAVGQAITYRNTDAAPDGADRTISFSVNDGALGGPTVETATVSLNPSTLADNFNTDAGVRNVISSSGDNDYATVSYANSADYRTGTGDFTWEAWIDPTGNTGTDTILSIGVPSQTVIDANFSTTPTNLSVSGTPSVTGGTLLLTPEAGGFGTATIDPTGAAEGARDFTASFDLKIGDGNVPAGDGMSFNYGVFESGVAEEGISTGLSLTFDTFDNGGEDISVMEVKVNGTVVHTASFPGGTARTDPGAGAATFENVTIVHDANGLDVSYKGVQMITNLDIVTDGYDPQTNHQFIFGARTGGVNDRHEVDNLQITANDLATRYALVVQNGDLAFVEESPTTTTVHNSNVDVSTGGWHHVGARYDGAGNLTLFIDGEPVKSFSGLSIDVDNGALVLGSSSEDSSADPWTGLMAEIRTWSDARSDEEILANFRPDIDADDANLSGYWKLNNDNGTGTSVTDESANNNTITFAGGANQFTHTTSSLFPAPDTSKWLVVDGNDPETDGDTAYVEDGELLLVNREIVRSVTEFDPSTANPVHVSGRFSYQNENDILTIGTRSNGVSDAASFGIIGEGISFSINDSSGANSGFLEILVRSGGTNTTLTTTGDELLELRAGTEYEFEVFDDGTNLRFRVTEVGNPQNTSEVTATSSFDPGTNYVTIHNREDNTVDANADGSFVARVSELRIDQDLATGEGDTISSLLFAPSSMTGPLTFTALDNSDGVLIVTNPATGAYTFAPTTDFHGQASYSYQVIDANGVSHVESVNVNVIADTDVLVAGQQLVFDGVNDYVEIGRGAGDGLAIAGDLTVEGWFKTDALGSTQQLISFFGDTGSENSAENVLYDVSISATGEVIFSQENAAGTNNNVTSSRTLVTVGEWTHIAAVRNAEAQTITIYIDGVAEETATYANNPTDGANAQLTLGGAFNSGTISNLFDGQMDDIRIWDTARTNDDIRLNYNQQLPGTENGLVANYSFDNVQDGVAFDKTANSNNGQLGTATLGDDLEPTTGTSTASVTDGPDIYGNVLEIVENEPFTGFMVSNGDLDGAVTYAVLDNNGLEQTFFETNNGGQVNIVDTNTGEWTYTPITNSFGSDTFTLRASGATSGQDDEVISVSISGGGDEPSINVNDGVLSVDGTGDHVKSAGTVTLTNFTLEAQFRGSENSSIQGIVATDDGTGPFAQIATSGNGDGELLIEVFDGTNSKAFTSSATPLDGEWHHVALTYDDSGNGTVRLFIDGVEDTSLATINDQATSFSVTDEILVGIERTANTTTGTFTGEIDDVRVWDDVRTPTEVATFMDQQLSGAEDNLQVYYRFDGEAEGTIVDNKAAATGAALDGTLSGDAHIIDLPSNAMRFDGSNDTIRISDISATDFATGTGSFTYELWMRTEASQTDTFFSVGENGNDSNGSPGIALRIGTDGIFQINRSQSGVDNSQDLKGGDVINDGLWHHIAIVHDAETGLTRLLVDGVPVAVDNIGDYNIDAGTMRLGAGLGGGNDYTGDIADVRGWNIARTDQEIADNMNTVLSGNENGSLVVHYTFDDISSGNAIDTAGTNDAELVDNGSGGLADDVQQITTSPNILGNVLEIQENDGASGTFVNNDVPGTATFDITGGGATNADGYITATTANGGTVRIHEVTGDWTYEPAENYHGNDTFTLTATGTITVNSVTTTKTDTEVINVAITSEAEQSATVTNDGVMSFDGVDDFVRGDLGTGTITNQMSFELRVLYQELDGAQNVIRVGETASGNDARYVLENLADNTLALFVGDGSGSTQIRTELSLAEDTWYDIAVTIDGTTASIYVDGNMVGTGTTVSAPLTNVAQSVTIGGDNAAANFPTKALVDEVRVWDTARTAEEIQQTHGEKLAGTETGLLIYYDFNDEGEAGVIQNLATATGNTSDGVITGNPKIIETPSKAVSFDGVDDLITVTNPTEIDAPAAGTWSFWMKSDGTWATDGADANNTAMMLSRVDSASATQGLQIGALQNGDIVVTSKDSNNVSTNQFTATGAGITDNVWHNVTVVYGKTAGDLIKVYVDGDLVSAFIVNDTWDFNGQDLLFGQSADAHWEQYKGQLDNVQVYDRALTDAEVAKIYTSLPQEDAMGLVGYYQFEETGLSATNVSTDANKIDDGALTGGVARTDSSNPVFGNAVTLEEGEGASGQMTADDVVGSSITYDVTGGTVVGNTSTLTIADKGTVTIDTSTGEWEFTPLENFNTVQGGALTFDLTASGDHGITDTETMAITVNQSDNASIIISDGVLDLDGTSGDVIVPDSAQLGITSNLTLEAWIKPEGAGSGAAGVGGIIISKMGAYEVAHYADGSIHFRLEGSDNTPTWIDTGYDAALNTWTHLSLVYDAAAREVKTYANGDLVGINSDPTDEIPSDIDASIDPLYIGAHQIDDQHFNGQMDEVRVWNTARTAEEVRITYDQQATGDETGLVGAWHFDENPGEGLVKAVSSIDPAALDGDLSDGATIVDATGPTIKGLILDITSGEAGNLNSATGAMIGDDVVGVPAFSVQGAASNGTAVIDPNTGVWTYTPNAGYVGSDSFTLRAAGGGINDDEIVQVAVNSDASVNVADGALNLDGNNDFVQVTADPDATDALDLSTNFTLEAWIQTTANGTQNIISNDNVGADTTGGYNFGVHNGTGLFYETNNTNGDQIVSNVLTVGQWHHVAVSFDNTADPKMTFFVDGDAVGTGNPTAPSATGADVLIGRRGFDNTQDFQGQIDDVRIWNETLTPVDIETRFDQQLQGDESGLQAYLRFDESGTTVTDYSQNSNVGTIVNGEIVNSTGRSLSFDGVDDMVFVTNATGTHNTADWTIESWINTSSVESDFDNILFKEQGSGENSYSLGIFDGKVDVRTNSTGTESVASSTVVADGSWHHVAGSYDSATKTLKVYVDGILENSVVLATDPVIDNTSDIYIGVGHDSSLGTPLTQYFDGSIDSVRLWNTTRSDQEIADNYNQTLSGTQGGALIGHYTFDDPDAIIAADGSGTSDGSVAGATPVDGPTIFADVDAAESTVVINEDQTASGYMVDHIPGIADFVAGTPSNGSVVIDSITGAWTYTPTANFNGTDTFTLSARDTGGAVLDTDTVKITVNSVDDGNAAFAGGSALQFNATTDFVEVGRGSSNELAITGDLTVEGWFNISSIGIGTQSLISFNPGQNGGAAASANNKLYELFVLNDGKIGIAHENGTGTVTQVESTSAIDVGEWVHVAAVRDTSASTITMYVNGNAIGTTYTSGENGSTGTYSNGPDGGADSLLTLGGELTGSTDGMMDEVRIWSDARTAEEIRANYDQQISNPGGDATLEGYWNTDASDGRTINDLSSNNNDGLLGGGKVLSLDGNGDYVSTSNNPLSGTTDFTAESWFNWAGNTTQENTILAIGNPASNGFQISTSNSGGKAFLIANINGVGDITTDYELVANEWHHIALVNDAGTWSFFVDGRLEPITGGTATSTSSMNAANATTYVGYSGSANQYFDGQIDDVRVWDEARTQSEINEFMTEPLVGNEANLALNYDFDVDSQGSAVTDKTSNSFDGTLQGDASLVLDSTSPVDSSAGAPDVLNTLGGAIDFDGVDQYLNAGRGTADALAITSDLTVETWIQFDDVSGTQGIIDFANPGGASAANVLYQVEISNGDIRYTHENGSGSSETLTFNTNLTTGDWYHISVSRDVSSKAISLYLDGELFETQNYTGNDPDGGGSSVLVIGATGAGGALGENPLDGRISDVRVWDATRSSEQIANNYNKILTGDQGGALVAHYPLNEITGTVVQDSANANDATAVNSPTAVSTGPGVLVTSVSIEEDGVASGQMTATEVGGTVTYSISDAGAVIDNTEGITTYTVANQGTVIIDQSTGNWTFTPADNYNGTVNFNLTATGNGATDTQPVSVTVQPTAIASSSISAGAIQFDGNPGSQLMADLGAGTFADKITLEYKVQFNSLDGIQQNLLTLWDDTSSEALTPYISASNELFMFVENLGTGGTQGVDAGTGFMVSTNTWYDIANVLDGTTARTYINGELISEVSLAGTVSFDTTSLHKLSIGGNPVGDDVINTVFDTHAMFDDVRVWNTARTTEQIRDNHDQQMTGDEVGLQAHYRFDEEFNGTVADQTSNGFDASVPRKALTLDGDSDYIEATTHAGAETGTGSFTWETWINTTASGTPQEILNLGAQSQDNMGFLRVEADGTVEFTNFGGNPNGSDISSLSLKEVNDGQWHHVAVTYDAAMDEATIFINGQADGIPVTFPDLNITSGALRVGANPANSNYFDGKIDDVRIWDDVRTQSEIQNSMHGTLSGSEANLQVYYDFDRDIDGTSGTVDNKAATYGTPADGSSDATTNATASIGQDNTSPVSNDGVSQINSAGNTSELFGNSITIEQDGIASGTMTANDVVGSSVSYSVTAQGDNGTVSINSSNGQWTYTPDDNFAGTDTFNIRAIGGGQSDIETITVTVKDDSDANIFSSALQFDGVDDVVTVAHDENLNVSANGFTVEFWVNAEGSSAHTGLLDKMDQTPTSIFNGWKINVDGAGTGAAFYIGDDDAFQSIGHTTSITDGSWHHVSAVYDATAETIELYVDGVASGSPTDVSGLTASQFANTENLLIGGDSLAGNPSLNGMMDDVRIWSEARTAQEIADNFDKSLSGNEANLQAYWKFDEAGGATIADVTGNGHTGTLGIDTNTTPTNSVSLDGDGDYVDVPTTVVSSLNAYTIETKVFLDDNTGEVIFISQHGGVDTRAFFAVGYGKNSGNTGLETKTPGTVSFSPSNAGGLLDSASQLQIGQLYHLAVTFDGTTARLYIDGVLDSSTTGSFAIADASGADYAAIGGGPQLTTTDQFQGDISDFRVWDRALNATEVADNVTGDVLSDANGLLVEYTFDDVTGSTIRDNTANNNDGTLTGDAVIVANDTTPNLESGTAPTFINSLGKALDFTASSDQYIDVGRGTGDNLAITGDLTVEAWLNLDSLGGLQQIASFRDGITDASSASNVLYQVYVDANGDLKYFHENGGGGTNVVATFDANLVAGQWYHIAAVRDDTAKTINFFVNGDAVPITSLTQNSSEQLTGTTATYSLDPTGGSSSELQIGRTSQENESHLNGQLSDFRIWDTARTSGEINANKDGLIDPATPGLVLNYAFDELNGTTVEDRSLSGNDGTTVNTPVIVDTALAIEGNTITVSNDDSVNGSITADVVGAATFSLSDTPDNGSLSLDAVTGLWEYKPADGFVGTDTFVIRAVGATSGIDEETVTLTVTAATDNNPSPTTSALQLGIDQTYIEFGAGNNDAFQITGDITLETWINPSELKDATIISIEGETTIDGTDTGNTNNALVSLQLQADGNVSLLHEPTDQDESGESFVFAAGLAAGTWAHLSAVRDATENTWTLYVNGEAFSARSYVEDASVGTNATFKIGGGVATTGEIINEFSGQIADIRVWDDVRTSDEVRDNYNQQLTGNEPNLVGYYTFEGDTTSGIQDRTSNGNDGYLVDKTPAGVTGNVLSLDGTGDYVELNYAEVDAIDLTSGTIETWVKIDDDTKGTIFAQQHGFSNSYAVFMVGNNPADIGNATAANDGKLFFRPQNAVGTPIESTSKLTPGQWHHVAVTFNSAGATLYIDGVADANVTGTNFGVPADPNVNTPTGTQAARIGDFDGAAGQELDGQLSNFRIWSEVRTAEEIREGMSQSYDYDTSDLAIQYTFDDVNGTTISDTSFSSTGGTRTGNIDGTLAGDANVTDQGAGQTNILNFLDQAVQFDGNGDVVTLATDTTPISGIAARSFMVWAKTSDVSGEQVLFSMDGDANPGSQLQFGLNTWSGNGGGKGITLDIGDAAITYAPVSSTADGLWHHYALVIPAGGTLADAELYQDGLRLTTVSARFNDNSGAVAINTLDNDTLKLSGTGTSAFNGSMAEASVWSSALTASEIQQYMNSRLDGVETGLEGYWRGDTDANGDVIDYSANANNGILTADATVIDVSPDVQSNNIQIVEDTIATGRMTGADVTGSATFSTQVAAANGTITIDSSTGVWNYSPNAGFAGTDTFTLRAAGSNSTTDDEVVSVRVGTDPIAPHDYALSFDGTNDYVDLGTVDNIVGAYSAEAWVNFDNFADGGENGWSRIFEIGDGTGGGSNNGFVLAAQGTTGELALWTYNGGTISTITANNPLPLNEWTHVAAVNDGAGSASLYINGSVIASTTNGAQQALPGMAFESAYIGRSTSTNDSYFNGQIADARLWDTARSSIEIANNYDRQLNGDEEGLAGYWNFNEGSGSIATDLSGNSNDGAVIGADYTDLTTITDAPVSGQVYKGLVLGADADGSNLSYTLNTAGNGAVTVDSDGSFDYTSTGADDSFTVDITDDDNNTTTHTVNIDH